MNLTEAKQILKANGYSLLKEMYDLPVDPPEGPDLPLEKWEEDGQEAADELLQSDAEYLDKAFKEKYPEVSVIGFEVNSKPDYNYFDFHGDWEYSKQYECVIEISIPLDVLGLTAENAVGEEIGRGIYKLTDQADKALDKFWAENYDTVTIPTDIEYNDYYDSFYDEEDNTCKLQMSGIYTYKRSSNDN